MKNTTIVVISLGMLYSIIARGLYPSPAFFVGAVLFGSLVAAHKYYLIKETLNGEHEDLVNYIESKNNIYGE